MRDRRKVYRFYGRTVTDAARKAMRELGDDAVVIDVRSQRSEGGRSRTELLVTQMDRVGIPSLVAFLAGADRGAGGEPKRSAVRPSMGQSDRWPARYERVRAGLLKLGVRDDQATVLIRQAWEQDDSLEALPWESVHTILDREAPCSPPLDLTRLQVLGIVGHPFTGRSTVAGGICRMAAEIIPGRVALLTSQEPVMPGDAVEVFGFEGPDDVARSLARMPELRLAVIDLPSPRPDERRLGLDAWLSMFPEMTLVPVVDALGPLAESAALVQACDAHPRTGWIMTGVDDDDQLGLVISLALASHGPLGVQGKEPDDVPRMRLARWDEVTARMSRVVPDAGTEEEMVPLAQSGGGTV